MAGSPKLFVNLAVRDLKKSMEFFSKLGVMYWWSFYDPDGHHWEVLWMDPKAVQ